MRFIDHSQSGEQEVLLRWARGVSGRLLDIGAGDGVRFSNTLALIELGWSAVLVEPAPWALDKLLDLHRWRENVVVVGAPVMGTRSGLVELSYARGDFVSTTDPDHRDVWASQVDFQSYWCGAVELRELLDRFGPFTLASIDAEGETAAILKAYRTHPHWEALRCVCYEVGDPTAAPSLRIEGWELLAETTNNVILAR